MHLAYYPHPSRPELTCHRCGVSNRERFVHPFTPGDCVGRPLDSPYVTGVGICATCFRDSAEEEGRFLHEPEPNVAAWANEQLKAIGLGEEERRADIEGISPLLANAIPDEVLQPMLAGFYPKVGLGLAGMARIGKSSAMAALTHALVLQNATNRAPFVPLTPVKKIFWMNWPLTCHQWRLDGVHWSIERTIAKASKVRLLILDDLARETERRQASEDVAIGHLDAIITARDRDNLVTLWTTNKSEDELVDRYGMGMVGRLLRRSPMKWIDGADFHPSAL